MLRNITDEQARHMVDILKKKSELIKNFSHKLEKYRISGDRETYKKKFRELLEKEEIKVYGEAGQEFCISKGLISFYAEPVSGYKFVKWCGYSDTYNSPLTSRFSNPGVFGSYGPVNNSVEIKLEAIYKVKGTSDPLGSCD